MKKIEQYIKEHTNKYSNHVELAANITGFSPWLTVDDAKIVAQIAREETIKEVCEWIEENIDEKYIYFTLDNCADSEIIWYRIIDDLKKHLEGKK